MGHKRRYWSLKHAAYVAELESLGDGRFVVRSEHGAVTLPDYTTARQVYERYKEEIEKEIVE